MQIDHSLLPHSQKSMLTEKARAILEAEVVKGCTGRIFPVFTELEPVFSPFIDPDELEYDDRQQLFTPAAAPLENDWVRLAIGVPAAQECDWIRNELVLKQLVALHHRTAFEITGNRDNILMTLLCHKEDEPVIRAALLGVFPACELSPCSDHPLIHTTDESWASASFATYYPPPPYSHLLTRPSELKLSPLEPFLNSLSMLAPPTLGVYQVVIQPVALDHDWHRMVGVLIDLEYMLKLVHNSIITRSLGQQAPSGQLNNKADDVESKSHSDKPFFCADVRVALLHCPDGDASGALRALSAFIRLFQHGGRPLECLPQSLYHQHVSPEQIRDIFYLAGTVRPGFLVNSFEACSLWHIPPIQTLIQRGVSVATANQFPARGRILMGGTHIGYSSSGNRQFEVFIPDDIRIMHTHMIGRIGKGKSKLLRYMAKMDILKGHGIAVIDPHGSLAEEILGDIPESSWDKVIYIDFGCEKYVPIWNALAEKQRADRVTDDVVRALTQITSGWGGRLETLLRFAIYGLIKTGQGTLAEVAQLLSPKSDRRENIRKRVLESIENEHVRDFFETKFQGYGKADFAPADHKLSKLLGYDTVQLMLSQPDSAFHIREVMDTRKILVVNLAHVGSESCDVLGSLILALLQMAALSRSDLPAERLDPFHVYVDEAPRFVSDAMEHMLAETRKFKVSLTLAQQYISQLEGRSRIDALGGVGTTIAFSASTEDAPRISRFLGGGVGPEDITSLGCREAIVRIDNDVVRITTPFLDNVTDLSRVQRVKEMSYARYYQPVDKVRETVRKHLNMSGKRAVMDRSFPAEAESPEDYLYEVFQV